MKITHAETFIVGARWRPWTFVKVETDEGVTGWGECSDARAHPWDPEKVRHVKFSAPREVFDCGATTVQ